MHMAIRGLYGEGTVAHGDFFQLSNQTTLGNTETQIVTDFTENILPAFIAYERDARDGLSRRDRVRLDDRIFRALGALQSARLMDSAEMMHLLSLVRLGVNMGRLEEPSLDTINDLFLLGQPAHLQRVLQREMDSDQRAAARATFIRGRLGDSD
jgi:protein arginine kinase